MDFQHKRALLDAVTANCESRGLFLSHVNGDKYTIELDDTLTTRLEISDKYVQFDRPVPGFTAHQVYNVNTYFKMVFKEG